MKLKRYFILTVVLSFAFLILFMPKHFQTGVFNALLICGKRLIPSLFLLMVLSSFSMSTGVFSPVCVLLSPIMTVFNLPKIAFNALFWGSVSGFPIGAKITSTLYSDKKITYNQATRLLAVSNNASPAFVIAVAGEALKSSKAGIFLFLSVIYASFLFGIYSGIYSEKEECQDYVNPSNMSISKAFILAVESSLNAILTVSAFVIFMSLITTLLEIIPVDFKILKPVIVGFFEVISGVLSFAYLSRFSFTACAVLLGFGGMSVLLQTSIFISRANLSIKKYFISKLTCSFISGYTAFFLYPLIFNFNLHDLFFCLLPVFFAFVLHKIRKQKFSEVIYAGRQFRKKHRHHKKTHGRKFNI